MRSQFHHVIDIAPTIYEAVNVPFPAVLNGVAVDGTRLFDAVGAGLADVPPDRVGAVILLTDGQVHDVPADPSKVAPGAPFHALLSGRDDERDRRIVIDSAPRFLSIATHSSGSAL